MSGVDYYELLGVPRSASSAEIKSAYRSLARAMHPDTGGTAGTFRTLQEAYETLSDPRRRAAYDRAGLPRGNARATPPARAARRDPRRRDFGADPHYVPPAPRPDPAEIPWWHRVDPRARVRFVPTSGYPRSHLAAAAGGWVLLLPVVLTTEVWPLLLVLWLMPAVAAAVARGYAPQYLPATPLDRAFTAEHGRTAVFGRIGAIRGDHGERLTAELLDGYLTRLPGARIFHGLSWPGSVFADVDHAVLCGRRLVLIESKMWLPGHYTTDDAGRLHRNGNRFHGGSTSLPEGVARYRRMLPDVDVTAALIVYPSRSGEITTGRSAEASTPPMTPEQFVGEVGQRFAEEPAVVDRDTFRAVLARVTP